MELGGKKSVFPKFLQPITGRRLNPFRKLVGAQAYARGQKQKGKIVVERTTTKD
jgi:hypothetical protein